MQVQRTFKKREGVWGIVKGDKGGASQVAPLSPLTKKPSGDSKEIMKTRGNQRVWNPKEMFRFAQHDKWNLWRCGFNRTQTRIAHKMCD